MYRWYFHMFPLTNSRFTLQSIPWYPQLCALCGYACTVSASSNGYAWLFGSQERCSPNRKSGMAYYLWQYIGFWCMQIMHYNVLQYILKIITIYSELREIVIPLGYQRWFRSRCCCNPPKWSISGAFSHSWAALIPLLIGCNALLSEAVLEVCMYIYILYILHIFILHFYLYIIHVYHIFIFLYPWYHRKSSTWFSHVDWFYPTTAWQGSSAARCAAWPLRSFSVSRRSDGYAAMVEMNSVYPLVN